MYSFIDVKENFVFDIALICALCLFLVVVVGVIIEFILLGLNKSNNKKISYNITNVRIYSLNIANNTIIYFDKYNMSKQVVTTLDAFYNSFKFNDDASQLRKWINNFIQNPEKKLPVITVATLNEHNKKTMMMLRITYYNKQLNMLHFEGVLLPRIKATKYKKNKGYNFIMTLDDIYKLAVKKRFCAKPASCILVKLNSNSTNVDVFNVNDVNTSLTTIYHSLNGIYQYLNKSRFLAFLGPDEVAIFDFKDVYKHDLRNLCKILLSEFEKFINIRALDNILDVNIGVSSLFIHRETSKLDIDNAIKKGIELANNVPNDPQGRKVLYEDDVIMHSNTDDVIIRNDITRLLSNNTIHTRFQPILLTDNSIRFFNLTYEPFGVSFLDYKDLLNNGYKQKMLRPIFDNFFINLTKLIKNERRNKYILNIDFLYLKDLLYTYPKFKDLDSQLVLALSFKKVYDLYQIDNVVLDEIKRLKEYNIDSLLIIDYDESDWNTNIISCFDYLMVNTNNIEKLHNSSQARNLLTITFNTLINYDKLMILNSITSQADIELAYEIGFKNFVSDVLAPYKDTPYIPDNFWYTKLMEDITQEEDTTLLKTKEEIDKNKINEEIVEKVYEEPEIEIEKDDASIDKPNKEKVNINVTENIKEDNKEPTENNKKKDFKFKKPFKNHSNKGKNNHFTKNNKFKPNYSSKSKNKVYNNNGKNPNKKFNKNKNNVKKEG